jgi:hypothetical protein
MEAATEETLALGFQPKPLQTFRPKSSQSAHQSQRLRANNDVDRGSTQLRQKDFGIKSGCGIS